MTEIAGHALTLTGSAAIAELRLQAEKKRLEELVDATARSVEERIATSASGGEFLAADDVMKANAPRNVGTSFSYARADHAHGLPSAADINAVSADEVGRTVATLDSKGLVAARHLPSAGELGALSATQLGTDIAPLVDGKLPIGVLPSVAAMGAVPSGAVGAMGGVAELDSNGYLPISRINLALLGVTSFKGEWNAETGLPVLPKASTANRGNYYVVVAAGNASVDGVTDWKLRDWVISTGSTWIKAPSSVDIILPITSYNRMMTVLPANLLYRDVGTNELYCGDGVTVGGRRVGGGRTSILRVDVPYSSLKIDLAAAAWMTGTAELSASHNDDGNYGTFAARLDNTLLYSKGGLLNDINVTASATIRFSQRMEAGRHVFTNERGSTSTTSKVRLTLAFSEGPFTTDLVTIPA